MCSFTVILPPYPSLELIFFSSFRRVRSWPHLQDFESVFCSFIPTFSKNLSLALSGTLEQSVVRLPFLQVGTTQIRRTPNYAAVLLPQEQGEAAALFCVPVTPFIGAENTLNAAREAHYLRCWTENPVALGVVFHSMWRSTRQLTGIEPAHSPI